MLTNNPLKVLVVGAGLYGATVAEQLTASGHSCTVIDKRPHVAGNCHTEEDPRKGILVHKYGPHIFHTNNKEVWDYVNRFTEFYPYQHRGYIENGGVRYPMPFNRHTAELIYNIPAYENTDKVIEIIKFHTETYRLIVEQKFSEGKPPSAKDWICAQVGFRAYDILYRGYTTKQWGTSPENVPYSVVARLPVRFSLESNWFKDDRYQGIPVDGYTKMVDRMLEGTTVKLGVDFHEFKNVAKDLFDLVVYTGPIDAYFDYVHGPLDWRSLKFITGGSADDDFQGCAVLNIAAEYENAPTRVIEHKHFLPFRKQKAPGTILTHEIPKKYDHTDKNSEPYYPVENEVNKDRLGLYKELVKKEQGVHFGGRLAEFKYYDMHQVIGAALAAAKSIQADWSQA